MGLMGTQHVVAGGDDGHVGAGHIRIRPFSSQRSRRLAREPGCHRRGEARVPLIGLALDAAEKRARRAALRLRMRLVTWVIWDGS